MCNVLLILERSAEDVAVQRIYQFLKSTVLGGLLVLVPVAALGYIVVQALEIAHKSIAPLLEWLPFKSVGGVSLALLLSILALVAACFVAGLLAETALIRGLTTRLERFILNSIPGYSLIKNVGEHLVGVEEQQLRKTVLVHMASSSQLGFLMETLPDGRLVVFIPAVPNVFAGSLHIVAADRVEVLAIPIAKALDVLGKLGVGLAAKWPRPTPPVGMQ